MIEIRKKKPLDELIEGLVTRTGVEFRSKKENDRYWVHLEDIQDAIFYLKEMNKRRKPIEKGLKGHVTLDKSCPSCGFMVNSKMNYCPVCGDTLANDGDDAGIWEPCNCPLTWDELKNLQGKPVWLKTSLGCEWVIIYTFAQLDDGSEVITTSSAILEESDCGVKWQAFRNEVQHE